ncbi:MAG: DUF3488 domain-containing protein [Candidatus Sumerlaeia bacterium]|nr:DUF3488 domain-containing protein [Candidatus Sumerlaeia bacterium]
MTKGSKGDQNLSLRVLDIPGLFLLCFALLAILTVSGIPDILVLFAGFALIPGAFLSRRPQPQIYLKLWNRVAMAFVGAMVAFQFLSSQHPQLVLIYICLFLLIMRWFTPRGTREHLQSWCLASVLVMIASLEGTGLFGIFLLGGWATSTVHLLHLTAVLGSHPGKEPQDDKVEKGSPAWSLAPATFRTLPTLIVGTFVITAVMMLVIPRTSPPEGIFPPVQVMSDQTSNLVQTGFSETISLRDLTAIHQSDGIALRIINPPLSFDPNRVRFRVSTLDHFDGWNWRRSVESRPGSEGTKTMESRDAFPFFDQSGENLHFFSVRLVNHPGSTIPIPEGFRNFSGLPTDVRPSMAPDGRVTNHGRPITRFDAWATHVPLGQSNRLVAGTQLLETHLSIPPELKEPIANVSGLISGGENSTDEEKADKIRAHFRRTGSYTLDLTGMADGPEGLRTFLQNPRGHCELFATAMALTLRSEGIPSRIVTGYFGSEPITSPQSGSDRQWMVLHRHAHAWVEAWIDGDWITFDPTPAPVFTSSISSNLISGGLKSYLSGRAERVVHFIEGYDQQTQQAILLSARKKVAGHLAGMHDGMWKRMGARFVVNIQEPRIMAILAFLLTVNLAAFSIYLRRGRIRAWWTGQKVVGNPSQEMQGPRLLRQLLVALGDGHHAPPSPGLSPSGRLLDAATRQGLPTSHACRIADLYDFWRFGDGGREVERQLRREIRLLGRRKRSLA